MSVLDKLCIQRRMEHCCMVFLPFHQKVLQSTCALGRISQECISVAQKRSLMKVVPFLNGTPAISTSS
ncbi:unnamed protein product [Moneuplotes crassus]|uniref:Uncharacterized protein n=1 Tax=Euplotes crassus TaxID=5936 RepID=A0AAD1U5P5_EUPCR|nr:unnamed protein product [Moneuplotes crassus]